MEKRILLSAIVLLVFAPLTVRAEVKSGKKSMKGSNKKEIPPLTIPAPEIYLRNLCTSMETCKECITAHPECAWCARQDMIYTVGGKTRCNYKSQIINECGVDDMVYILDTIETIANAELSDRLAGVTENEVIQIKPQKIKLSLKPKSAFDLKIEYLQAVDYPVDLSGKEVPINTKLSEQFEDSSRGKLAEDTSNIFQLVQDHYEKLTSSVMLKDNATDNVRITYYSSCLGDKAKEKTNICKGLQVGMNVTFEAKIEVISCPENRDEWNQTIQIYPVGLNESLLVDLHMICECDCEKPWNQERNSPKCSGGTYQCGVCSCYDFRYGKECECEGKPTEGSDDDKACIAPHDTRICSGRGICRCGICECFNKISVQGPFCECDSYSCDRSNGLICGGKDHGTCECGVCKCKPGWKGPACNCMTDIEPCRSPLNGEICHGHGECVCGRCQCNDQDGNLRSGHFCEDCPACHEDRCQEYKECVQCTMFHSGPLSQEGNHCLTNCSNYIITEVDKSEVNENDEHLCSYKDDDDCRFYFVYKFNEFSNSLVEVRAQRAKDHCPEELKTNKNTIILGVVLGIVFISSVWLYSLYTR